MPELDERKRQVARRLRLICPDMPADELDYIVERVAMIELEYDSGVRLPSYPVPIAKTGISNRR